MFNEQYGLQSATLKRDKWNTRRWLSNDKFKRFWWDEEKQLIYYANTFDNELVAPRELQPKYKIGEEVAIAQSYKDAHIDPHSIVKMIDKGQNMFTPVPAFDSAGWTNKMFVKAELMPHHIQITGIKVERLQDISDEDCLAEGIMYDPKGAAKYGFRYGDGKSKWYRTPKDAFSSLIDKVSGRGTWDENPWVVAYAYKLKD